MRGIGFPAETVDRARFTFSRTSQKQCTGPRAKKASRILVGFVNRGNKIRGRADNHLLATPGGKHQSSYFESVNRLGANAIQAQHPKLRGFQLVGQ